MRNLQGARIKSKGDKKFREVASCEVILQSSEMIEYFSTHYECKSHASKLRFRFLGSAGERLHLTCMCLSY